MIRLFAEIVVRPKLLIFLSLLLIIGGAAGGAFWVLNAVDTPYLHEKANAVISIPQGTSPDDTVSILAKNGVIQNEIPLKALIRIKHAGPDIKAGDYTFASPITPSQVLAELERGGLPPNKLTIIEGWTKWDVAKAMVAKADLKLHSEQEALQLMNDTSAIRDLDPTAQDLEGYMFPDTYFISSTTTAKDLLNSSVQRFRQVWDEHLSTGAMAGNKSTHDLVTIASIIETEAKLNSERPIVASVIINRMRANMTLSVDSTIIYASKLAGKWRNNGIVYKSDVERRSLYNTRIFKGLPPGPVGNPGLPSLRAAMTPAPTKYLYYVRNPDRNDGAHNFYEDPAGFEKGVEALRAWEVKRGPVPIPQQQKKPVVTTETKTKTTTETTTKSPAKTTTTTTTTVKNSSSKKPPQAVPKHAVKAAQHKPAHAKSAAHKHSHKHH